MKTLQLKRLVHFVGLTTLLFGLSATGCDGILGIDGLEVGCNEGAARCAPFYDNWLQTCNDKGTWLNSEACSIGEICKNGACVSECLNGACECTRNESPKCIDNAPHVCSAHGQWLPVARCFDQTCVNGACQGECAPGTRCLDDTPQECNQDGYWQDLQPCESGQDCVAGSCTCTAGDRRCFENRPQLCNSSNQWVDVGFLCNNQACHPAGGCVGVCEPGQKQCLDTKTPRQCDSKGQWQTEATCDLDCFAGICATCTPGDIRCTGNTPEHCNENGQWQDEAACVNQTCIAGKCQGQCASGSKRCAANYPQTCNAGGAWENSVSSCGACKECNAGTCNATAEPDAMCIQPTLIEVGAFHTCALQPNQTMQCWGYNASGQLGLGDTNNRGDGPNEMGANLPRLDLGSSVAVKSIAAGTAHTCAGLSNGGVKCWGNNAFAQLGLGDSDNRGDGPSEMGASLLPVNLGAIGIDVLGAGETHTCALGSNGSVKCWGGNYYGQLGLGDTKTRGDEPNEMGASLSAVELGANATLISAGNAHTCVRLSSITIKCWGNNSFGQLGLGDTNHRGDQPNEMGANLLPVDLDLPPGIIVKDISAGGTHTCALLSDGSIKCWGNNPYGQLGQGDTNTRGDGPNEMGAALPIVELGLGPGMTVLSISAGSSHTCALLSNGQIKCWGRNDFGQLGLGDTNHRGDEPNEMGTKLPAIDLGPGVSATSIHAGHSHTCALLSSGRVKCWGRSVVGQLGQSDTVTRGDEPIDMGDALLPVDL